MFTEQDVFWMRRAILLAEQAAVNNEVPVGAVLISEAENTILGEGLNASIGLCDPTAHAEIVALRAGAKNLKNYRLVDTTLYVTLEPCVMCVGAIVHARVSRVVFGASDPKAGAVCSVFQFSEDKLLNHRVNYQGGLLAEECGELLKKFFRERR